MLNVSRLNKRFGDLAIFENFDLTLSQNGFTVLIGPSGCGKSTLFNVLTGAVAGDGGGIVWGGKAFYTCGRSPPTCSKRICCCPGFL
jgi:NitT/TauT family transport system ATP-binding protein